MKSLFDNEQVQKMLKSQEERARRDRKAIRQKQAEMLEKFKQKREETNAVEKLVK